MLPVESSDYQECISMWNPPKGSPEEGGLKDLWDDARVSYYQACEKYKTGDKQISFSVAPKKVVSSGYFVNGINAYFPKNFRVGVDFTFDVSDKKTLNLNEATLIFSEPILAASNFHLNLNLGEMIGGALGLLSEKSVIKIMTKVSTYKFNKAKTGLLDKAIILAYDRAKFKPSSDKLGHTIFLTLSKDEYYYERGWGIYTFGSSKKDCLAMNKQGYPSEFLGNHFGSENLKGVCRARESGPRFGRPMIKWMLKEKKWADMYNKYLENGKMDPGLAFLSVINTLMGSGVQSDDSSWEKLAADENKLGTSQKKP